MFSAFNPSKWSSGQATVGGSVPCSRVSPQSWTLPARAGIQTHNLGLSRVSSPTLYPLGHDCPLYIAALNCSGNANRPELNCTVPNRTVPCSGKAPRDSIVKKGPAEAVLPSPAEEVQPATGAAETVTLCHYWICPLHVNNCLVNAATKSDHRRLRRVIRTAEQIIGTTIPTLQDLYSSRVSKRAGKITLDPSNPANSLFELLLLLVDATELWVPEWPDQEQFLPSSNPSHEILTIIMVHTLFIHLFI